MNTCGRVEVHLHSILTKIVFPRKPLNGTLGGPDSGWGLFGEGINLLPLPGIEYDSFDTQRKAESTCRLLYRGSRVWHDSIVITVELTTCTGP